MRVKSSMQCILANSGSFSVILINAVTGLWSFIDHISSSWYVYQYISGTITNKAVLYSLLYPRYTDIMLRYFGVFLFQFSVSCTFFYKLNIYHILFVSIIWKCIFHTNINWCCFMHTTSIVSTIYTHR